MIDTKYKCITGDENDYAEFTDVVHRGKDVTALTVSECGEDSIILLSNQQLINLRDTLLDAFPLEKHPY